MKVDESDLTARCEIKGREQRKKKKVANVWQLLQNHDAWEGGGGGGRGRGGGGRGERGMVMSTIYSGCLAKLSVLTAAAYYLYTSTSKSLPFYILVDSSPLWLSLYEQGNCQQSVNCQQCKKEDYSSTSHRHDLHIMCGHN